MHVAKLMFILCKRMRLLNILARFRRLFRQMFCLKAKLGIFRWASSFYFEGGSNGFLVRGLCRTVVGPVLLRTG